MTPNSMNKKNLLQRPPIVVIMGHVDHGKTKLLDYIRKTNIAEKEAGGITQSIGAYEISRPSTNSEQAKKITFLDTPGHEAFSKMRSHGARIADVAILVVAADEGVKPQTKDALKHILEAKIPFVVAINKIDKPGADVEKIKQELSQSSVYLEGYGGNISWQAISAKDGTGIPELLDLILLTADLEGLTYDPSEPAQGVILSCHLDPRRGIMISAILENGSLRTGEEIFTPTAKGKIKILQNFKGEKTDVLTPSAPALILGFETMPEIGDEFSTDRTKIKTTERLEKIAEQNTDENALPLILKANEAGSLAALEHIIGQIKTPLKITDKSTGDIYESDVNLAAGTRAVIIGFKIKVDRAALNLAKSQNVTIITSLIIYDLEKQLQKYITAHVVKPKRIFEVLAIFGARKETKQIIGGKVTTGPIKNQEVFEVSHNEGIIGKGKILNLQAQKKDAAEVTTDSEAGMLVDSNVEIKSGMKLLF